MTVGDWVCACGQRYRVVVEEDAVSMWPESAAGDYRDEPIDGTCVCGAPVDDRRVAAAIAV